MPWYARPENPIDPTGAMSGDPDIYRRCLEVLVAEPSIGLVAVSQDSPAHFDLAVAEATVAVARASTKPFVFFSNISGPYRPEVQLLLREAGVPYLQGIRESLKAIKALIDYHARPFTAPPSFKAEEARRRKAQAILAARGPMLDEHASKQLLVLYGIPVVPEKVVTSTEAAVLAADELGYPVVAKVLSPDILHKTSVGGVHTALGSALDVEQAILLIKDAVAKRRPGARLGGYLIQPMVKADVELMMGLKHDPQFGSTVVFGIGGIFVEAIRQMSMRVAPISEADVREMIAEVPALSRMLQRVANGFDPSPLLAPLLMRLSDLAIEIGGEIEEIDMNPILLNCAAKSVTVVDALIVRRRAGSDERRR